MALGLRPLEACQPGPLLMRRAVASFLCFFDEEVHRTAAFTCEAHIDEDRGVVGHLQPCASTGATLCSTARAHTLGVSQKTALDLAPAVASDNLPCEEVDDLYWGLQGERCENVKEFLPTDSICVLLGDGDSQGRWIGWDWEVLDEPIEGPCSCV